MSETGKFYELGKPLPTVEQLEIASYLVMKYPISIIRIITKRSRNAIKRVKRLLDEGGDLFENQGRPNESGEHTAPYRLDYLLELLMKYPVTDLDTLKATYESAFECTISISMIHYILTKHLRFVWKRTEIVEWAQTRPQIQRLRKQFLFHFLL